MNLKQVFNKVYRKRDVSRIEVSSRLKDEIQRTQDLLEKAYKKKYKKKRKCSRLVASDFIATEYAIKRRQLKKRWNV